MAYGELFDLTQAQLPNTPNWLGKLAFGLIAYKRWRKRLMPLLTLYLVTGMRKPLRQTGWLKKLHLAEAEALLTKPSWQSLARHYPAASKLSPCVPAGHKEENWVGKDLSRKSRLVFRLYRRTV
jgi:glycolate oxidase iron-sulfur subunit